jgi:hypothetical protein
MRLPPKDDPGGDREGRLPLDDVLTVLRRYGVTVKVEPHPSGGDVCCTLTSDAACEVHFLPDPVGGLMVKHLARKFDVPTVQFYYFRQLDDQARRGPVQ